MNGTISVANTAAQGADVNNNNRKVVFKICAPFTNYISEISNAQVDNAKDIDVVMLMYDLIENNDNYSKTSGSLWQYYRDESSLDKYGNVADFSGANHANHDNSSFQFKQKITGQTGASGRKMLKQWCFWRTLEMLLNPKLTFSNMVCKLCYSM